MYRLLLTLIKPRSSGNRIVAGMAIAQQRALHILPVGVV